MESRSYYAIHGCDANDFWLKLTQRRKGAKLYGISLLCALAGAIERSGVARKKYAFVTRVEVIPLAAAMPMPDELGIIHRDTSNANLYVAPLAHDSPRQHVAQALPVP